MAGPSKFDKDDCLRSILISLDNLSETTNNTNKKIDETIDHVVELDKKIDLHIQKTEYELLSISKLDMQQNELLAEHSQRSTELKRDNDLKEMSIKAELRLIEERIEQLEKPAELLKSIRNIIVYLGSVGTALYAISKIFGWF